MKLRGFIRAALTGALCLGLMLTGAAAAEPEAPAQVREVLAIYSTGGLGGQFYEQDPVSGRTTESNYLKVSSAMAEQRQQMAATLLLDSGDALFGGMLSGWDLDADRDPAALVFRTIGYDAFVPGLGEFLAPTAYRERFFAQLTAEDETGSAPTALLSGNFLDAETQEPVLEPCRIVTVELAGQSWSVGLAGLGALDAAQKLPAVRQDGYAFRHEEDDSSNPYVQEWTEHLSKALDEAGPRDLTVVVCDAEDVSAFVSQTRGIDLVLTHTGTPNAWAVPNADGVEVPCISSGGTALTRALVSVGEDGALSVTETGLLDLYDYPNDAALSAAVSGAYDSLARIAAQKTGTLAGEWSPAEGAPYVQTEVFDLVARSMCWAAEADAALLSPAKLGLSSLDTLFPRDARTAPLSLQACYALYPQLSDSLCLVELTGAQLMSWLDYCAGQYGVDESGHFTGGENADALYGMDYELYAGDFPGYRVQKLTWKGEPVSNEQRFQVAVPASRLTDPNFPEAQVLWTAASDVRFAARGGSIPAVLASYAENLALLAPLRESTWSLYVGSSRGPINRLEFVTMLYELAGRPEPAVDTAFVDLSGDPAAVWAAESGIVSGDGQGNFLPAQVVTREQAAVILARFAQIRGLTLTDTGAAAQLLDYVRVSQWARPAVAFCYETGVMPAVAFNGKLFLPQDTFTRQEAADFLAALGRLLEAN